MDPVAEEAARNEAITLIANGMAADIAIKQKCKLPYKSRDSKYRQIRAAAAKIIKARFVTNCRKQFAYLVDNFIYFVILHNYSHRRIGCDVEIGYMQATDIIRIRFI